MIASEIGADFLGWLAYTAGVFCCGVSWAAYRAVGWVDRMRRWAASVQEVPPHGEGLPGRAPGGVPGDGPVVGGSLHGSASEDLGSRSPSGGWS